MTLQEALAFRLPDGKTLGKASAKDWAAVARFYVDEAARLGDTDITKLGSHEKAQWQAAMDRQRDFRTAVAVVKEWLQGKAAD
jgi:hypothetical protein